MEPILPESEFVPIAELKVGDRFFKVEYLMENTWGARYERMVTPIQITNLHLYEVRRILKRDLIATPVLEKYTNNKAYEIRVDYAEAVERKAHNYIRTIPDTFRLNSVAVYDRVDKQYQKDRRGRLVINLLKKLTVQNTDAELAKAVVDWAARLEAQQTADVQAP